MLPSLHPPPAELVCVRVAVCVPESVRFLFVVPAADVVIPREECIEGAFY